MKYINIIYIYIYIYIYAFLDITKVADFWWKKCRYHQNSSALSHD